MHIALACMAHILPSNWELLIEWSGTGGYGCRLGDSLLKTATFGAITVALKGTDKYYELVTKWKEYYMYP